VAAEFKKASPSKGDINADLDPVEQCLKYTQAGVSVISVLTEFQHFKGTLNDMKRVRIATQKWCSENSRPRPAVLRKDFILDRYQILEARANGADTVLLIVAVLGVKQLEDLIAYCRRLDMEPLVEVNTQKEVEIAIKCGAKVLGVNNRNLHTFQLDLETTKRAIEAVNRLGKRWHPIDGKIPEITIAALSGIASPSEVRYFKELGVSCCLIGETLMKSSNPTRTIHELLGKSDSSQHASNSGSELVKICGMVNLEDVNTAISSGADLIGIIFAKQSPRRVDADTARSIVDSVRRYGERRSRIDLGAHMDKLRTEQVR